LRATRVNPAPGTLPKAKRKRRRDDAWVGSETDEYRQLAADPRKGTWAPRGAYIVTAKLPERDGEFEYRIRSAIEDNERMARESELQAISESQAQTDGGKRA
jgi:hypothetical protein